MPSAPIGRRPLARLAATALVPTAARHARAESRIQDGWLTLGLDIGDVRTLDPARQIDYAAPLALVAVYDTLVTFAPGHYDAVVPSLAATWERVAGTAAWRFTLWPDVAFASGQPVTPDDVAFSLNRLIALRDVPAQLMPNLAGAAASGPATVDVMLHDPDLSPLGSLASPACAVLERAAVTAQDGTERANAAIADRATPWLDQHSAGSGAYVLQGWERRRDIRLSANPGAWRRRPGFAGVAIRHIPDSTAQMRAIERGDIDAAFNLAPEHVDALRTQPGFRIESVTALDFAYLALGQNPQRNAALAQAQVRRAIACAIDYDSLVSHLLGGQAVRPASFLPVGVLGNSAADARALAPATDLDKARALLHEAGQANGFAFELTFPDAGLPGLAFETLARALRRDLERVGIDVRLRATSPANFRAAYADGRLQAALAFWTEPVIDPLRWAEAALDRLGPRLFQDDPAATRALARRAAAAAPDQAPPLWADWQRAMIERANLLPLFQPSYQIAVRSGIHLALTAAGWMAQLDGSGPS